MEPLQLEKPTAGETRANGGIRLAALQFVAVAISATIRIDGLVIDPSGNIRREAAVIERQRALSGTSARSGA